MSGRFSQAFIDKVIDATDIVHIISAQTRLTKKGPRYFGVCPFHAEKTPSFSVNPEKKLYYCFGCGAGGNVIGYVMEQYKYSFPEAIEFLANQAHIPVEYEEGSYRKDDGTYRKKQRMYEMNKLAARYFYANLKKNQQALAYLKKRELSDETIETFGLGYAPGRGGLTAYLKTKKFSDAELFESSLVRKNERGYYDYFRDRLMFPIMDIADHIVAFGGRVMGKGEPKYLNSPETSVFFKHNTLFNLNRAKKDLPEKPLIIVEGYMDVISLYDKRITNVCATLGTALSEGHAKLIGRYTDNVVLCYDGDNAGRKAAVRGADILHQAGLEPKILLLKDGMDPDDVVKQIGAEAFEKQVSNSMYVVDFKIGELRRKFDLNDIVQKAHFIKDACAIVSKLDPIKWDHYVKILANLTASDPRVIKQQITELSGGVENPQEEENPQFARETRKLEQTQKMLLKYILQSEEHFRYFLECGGSEASFLSDDFSEVYHTIQRSYENNSNIDLDRSLLYNNKIALILAEVYAMDDLIQDEEVEDYIRMLEIKLYKSQLGRMKQSIYDHETSGDNEQVQILLKEYNYLKKKLLELQYGGERQ